MEAPALRRQLVLGTAMLLVLAQLGFRAWALYPSWFYYDDYKLLGDASGSGFALSYLIRPYDSQFMPLGRALAWLVAHAGQMDWALAASFTLVLQLLASAACAWMLFTLFGVHRHLLLPLGVYLTSAITMPGLMWWAAALNQLPLQIVFFGAVGAWVRYLRDRHPGWLALTTLFLVIGVLSYVKALLVLVALVFLLLGYFCSGGWRERLRQGLHRGWSAAVVLGLLAAGFLVYYVTQVPQVFASGDQGTPGGLASTMLGSSLTTGVLGGPGRWGLINPPAASASPPAWAVHLAWVVIVLSVTACALRRNRTLRAWALLGTWAVADYILLLVSRGQLAGDISGTEYRYLTDVVPVLALCMGLATTPLVGAVESSNPREHPLLLVRVGELRASVAVAFVCVLGLFSSVGYANIWHQHNPGFGYVTAMRQSLSDQGNVDLADQPLPKNVVRVFKPPYNTTGHLAPLVVRNARFPRTTPDLAVLDEFGTAHRAIMDVAVQSPTGPDGACGWRIRASDRLVPMNATTFQYGWWLRIGYLAGSDGTLHVVAGTTVIDVPVQKGLHSVFVRAVGTIGGAILGSSDTAGLCVDTVEVGQPVAGAPL